ncbi:MAG: NB-ARC domain-containing protein, partial [Bacteroidota bacterium]
MKQSTYFQHLRDLLAKDELATVLAQLQAIDQASPYFNEIIGQSARLANLQYHIRTGQISAEDATVNRNQLRLGLLDLIDLLAETTAQPTLQGRGLREAIHITQRKNVNTGTATAGGNIHFGDRTETHHHHYRARDENPKLLTNPPLLSEVFEGREDDMQRVREHFTQGNQALLLLVNGRGGMGKTTLAAHYFNRYKEDYRRLAWVFAERGIGQSLQTLEGPLGIQPNPHWTSTERVDHLFLRLAQLPDPCLLVLDNANAADDLAQFAPRLQSCTNLHVLCTTRVSQLDNLPYHEIKALERDQALSVFRTHYRNFPEAATPHFDTLYEQVQGNTLVLELFAKTLNHFNNKLQRRYPLPDLIADAQRNLLALSKITEVRTRYHAHEGFRQATPEEIIAAMYELSELSEPEQNLLANFAALPAEAIPYETLQQMLEVEELDTHLLALAQKGWLEEEEEVVGVVTFKCSPVIQAAAQRQH